MIDLPFIGKVKLDGLTLNQAQNILIGIVKDFYRNPDLQINIEEFNSSKVYIVGAVRNQKTIKFEEKPSIWAKGGQKTINFDQKTSILTARCASCRRPCLEPRCLGFSRLSEKFSLLQALRESLEVERPGNWWGCWPLQSLGKSLEAQKPVK